MMLQTGCVVRSIAGHDKDRFYVVVNMEAGKAFIADGKRRKLEKPKAKNPLHLRPTLTVLDLQAVTTDKKLRRALLPFNGTVEKEGGNELCQRQTSSR